MPVLNHHIVASTDSEGSARFYSELLGLEPGHRLGWFVTLQVSEDTSLFFSDSAPGFDRQHYAFLVTESEFDEIFAKLRDRDIPYWSDPSHRDPDHINYWDDGRGVYFDDLEGHHLEVITRRYGSGGTTAKHVHPLLAQSTSSPSGSASPDPE